MRITVRSALPVHLVIPRLAASPRDPSACLRIRAMRGTDQRLRGPAPAATALRQPPGAGPGATADGRGRRRGLSAHRSLVVRRCRTGPVLQRLPRGALRIPRGSGDAAGDLRTANPVARFRPLGRRQPDHRKPCGDHPEARERRWAAPTDRRSSGGEAQAGWPRHPRTRDRRRQRAGDGDGPGIGRAGIPVGISRAAGPAADRSTQPSWAARARSQTRWLATASTRPGSIGRPC